MLHLVVLIFLDLGIDLLIRSFLYQYISYVLQLLLSDEVIDVESVDDEASTMPPPLAPNIVHNLRQQVFSVPLDAFTCELKGPDGQIIDPELIFPDLPPYDKPRPSDKDLIFDYIHHCRIMPITKRMYRNPPHGKCATFYLYTP